MQTQNEIRENLMDAGCSPEETDSILSCICENHLKDAEKQVEQCRKKQLAKLHESQKCIDRLDYLVWQMKKGR